MENLFSQNMLNIIKQNLKDPEERKRLIKSMLNNTDDSQLRMAAFCQKDSGECLNLKQLVEKEGREKAEEILDGLLKSIAEEGSENKAFSLSPEEANYLIKKVEHGEANKDEQAMVKLLKESDYVNLLRDINGKNMVDALMHMMIQAIIDVNEDVYYDPTFVDFSIFLNMLFNAALCLTPDSIMSKYKDASIETISSIGNKVAEDIKTACNQAWQQSPKNPEFIVMGLLSWLIEICAENDFKFPEGKAIKEFFGLNDDESYDDDQGNNKEDPSGIPGITQPVCNGSNDKVIPFENNQMKNLLKDD